MPECISPIRVKNDNNDYVTVPCSKCPNCMKRKIAGWAFRLMQEEKVSSSSLFITLTYDTDYVPITETGRFTLCKRDVQLFFKKLRKAHKKAERKSIKYYAVGEYGTETKRPHYHIILFNAQLELIQPSWTHQDTGKIKGLVHYGLVSEASVGYTLKYVSKPPTVKVYGDDRAQEFSLMSKGLGKSYMTKAMIKWHHDNYQERLYCSLKDGVKVAMPRYYKEKVFDEYQRIMSGKYQREKMLKDQADFIKLNGYDEYYRKQLSKHLAAIKKYEFQNRKITRQKI